MSYVKTVLQPGENLVMVGHLHWIVYWHAITLLVVGTGLVFWEWAASHNDVLISISAIVFGAPFLYFFVRTWIERWTTEFAVTDRRVIFKRGLITRHTAEMNMDKVESVDVDQSVLGRMLDYGTIHVIGTGQGIEHLHRIAAPLALRSVIIAK